MTTLPTVDLATASRAELVALIGAQQTVIGQLQARIATLEQRLGSGGKGMPGTKPAAQTRSKATGKPRKRRAQGFARRRSPTPTRRVTHAADHCPHCGTRLLGGWVHRRREVIDLPVVPVEVVEHVILARQCPLCERRVLPTVDLGDTVAGKQRLGARLLSLIVTLREDGRLPFATIRWYLQTVHGLRLSVGALVAACRRVAAAGAGAVRHILAEIRAGPAVHADETGWRENGRNGYVWTFATPTHRYFVRRGRGKEVVDEVLGEQFSGVLSSDFYAAYHHYPGRKQRCWAHLLRDIHDLCVLYPRDAGVRSWATAVHEVYAAAVAWVHAHTALPADTRARLAAQQAFEARLLALCTPFLTDPVAVQAKLCRRIERHLPELFVFVARPDVPPDNNAAERSLRHLVTARKISGGTRSPHGTDTTMTLASLFGTWRAQGIDPLRAAHQLLLSPQL
jgi:transposase